MGRTREKGEKRMRALLICLTLICTVGEPTNYPPQHPKGPNGPSQPTRNKC